MTTDQGQKRDQDAESFARQAEQRAPGIVREFWGLLRHHKKWWLGPIIVLLLIMSALVLIFGTPVAPLIYTLF